MEVEYPQNDFTRMIEEVSSGNRSGVHREGVASATPLPTVQSADLGREVPPSPEMSAEERAELDRLAVAAGVKDERLGTAGPEAPQGAYASLEEAMAAGAPVNQPTPEPVIERVPAGTRGIALQQQARAPVRTIVQPRLPDFRKVEGIDLVQNRVVLDGMDFPITDEQAAEFKQFVVEVARTAIMDRLNEAVGLFSTPETVEVTDGGTRSEGTDTEVQQQPEGSSAQPPQ